jgi:hypothetical protein
MSDLSHVLYVSTASALMTPSALADMLRRARARNDERSVTGLLLYRSGNFLQYFEGPPDTVRMLHETIKRDPRHYGIITVHEGPIGARQFGAWSMGFDDLSGLDPDSLEGFSDFLRAGFRDPLVLRDMPFMLRFLEHFADRT